MSVSSFNANDNGNGDPAILSTALVDHIVDHISSSLVFNSLVGYNTLPLAMTLQPKLGFWSPSLGTSTYDSRQRGDIGCSWRNEGLELDIVLAEGCSMTGTKSAIEEGVNEEG